MYSYEKFVGDADRIKKDYCNVIECYTIGYSVCGRKIILLKLGCGQKSFFITSGVHGRESANTPALMRMIERYAYSFGNDSFLNDYSFYIVPLLNPDGYVMATTDRKLSSYKLNANGVDINRNFPSVHYKSGGAGGACAGSEPETKALMSALGSHPSQIYIDIHSRGEVIYYYRSAMSDEYNDRQYAIADRLSKATGYELVPPEDEIASDDSGGNTVHYVSETYGIPAITIETLPDNIEFPIDSLYSYDVLKHLEVLFETLAGVK